MLTIKHRFTGATLYQGNHATIREAAEAAVAARANLAGADLDGANLIDANLTRADLTGANLIDANLTRADLTGANLTGANLDGADLTDADLDGAPTVPDLDERIEAATRAPSALNMASWHTCATTHCRAGWAIVMAGEEGRALEARIGPGPAGALIYGRNSISAIVPDFHSDDEEARADIVRRADEARAAKLAAAAGAGS